MLVSECEMWTCDREGNGCKNLCSLISLQTPLHISAKIGSWKCLRALLHFGADVAAKDVFCEVKGKIFEDLSIDSLLEN